jgi:hypothetical protein
MEPKGSSAVSVTAQEVREGLARRPDLGAAEENTLRMRYGASAPDPKAPLPQAHGGRQELKDELLLLELQLLRAYRQHKAMAAKAPKTSAKPSSSVDGKAKDKIVRGLRKKKDR